MTRVQADVVAPMKDWLATQSLGAEVRTNVAGGWKPADGPVLVVADDGGPVLWPVKSDHTVRLTAYAAGRTEARRIVTLAAGRLAESYPRVRRQRMGAVLDARDKSTGAMLASVLVPVHARTVQV